MPIHLDHLMVPSRNKVAVAKRLAELLGVPWAETGVGPFCPVYVNEGWLCRKVYELHHMLKRLSEKNTTHCG
jgi:hypothetical protein